MWAQLGLGLLLASVVDIGLSGHRVIGTSERIGRDWDEQKYVELPRFFNECLRPPAIFVRAAGLCAALKYR